MKDMQLRLSHLARYEIRALKSTLREGDKEMLREALSNKQSLRNIYSILTGHHNSDRALGLIRLCAPFLYPATQVETLALSVETWTKKILTLEYGSEPEDTVRLFWSPLEMAMLRVSYNEKLGIVSYLLDETQTLIKFNTSEWELVVPELVKVRA